MKTIDQLKTEPIKTIKSKELTDFNTAYLDAMDDGSFVVSVDEFVHFQGNKLKANTYYEKLS